MARLPEDTELVDIYNSDETKSQLENIAEITSNDRLPVVDAETNELKNASVKQITKGLDEEELVIKLQGVTVYDGTETIEIKKDSRIQLNNGCTVTIKSGAPSGGVGTKLLCMAKDGTGTVLCEDGGNRFSVPDGKYIELIYTIGGWTFYSQMVRLTLAEYEALGDRVNSDNVVYLITDDEASMDSNPTVQGLTVLNGTTLNGNLSVKGNATFGGTIGGSGFNSAINSALDNYGDKWIFKTIQFNLPSDTNTGHYYQFDTSIYQDCRVIACSRYASGIWYQEANINSNYQCYGFVSASNVSVRYFCINSSNYGATISAIVALRKK